MRCLVVLLLMLAALPAVGADYMIGADVSFLPQVEQGGAVFRSDGAPQDFFTIISGSGLNTVRLRLWHNPADGHSGLAEALDLAERAQTAGLDILLDFHYSDTWADPAHQTKPAAWATLDFATLTDSVRAYTRDVLTAFNNRGLAPTMVQLGNEITPGMLWDEGRVSGAFNTPLQWTRLASLLSAAVSGVADAYQAVQAPEVMIHLDRGGDNGTCRWFFDHLVAEGVAFDVIGLSYYPWWHGSLSDLEQNLTDLAGRYDKDLVIVETAYPWTLGWFDNTHNIVGLPEHVLPGFEATPAGQKLFWDRLHEIAADVPLGKGRGVFWWAPEWVAAPTFGSAWENLTLFDEQGNALPALSLGQDPAPVPDSIETGLRLFPNPFQYETTVRLAEKAGDSARMEVWDVRGRRVFTREGRFSSGGWAWRPGALAAGLYFVSLTTPEQTWHGRITLVR